MSHSFNSSEKTDRLCLQTTVKIITFLQILQFSEGEVITIPVKELKNFNQCSFSVLDMCSVL